MIVSARTKIIIKSIFSGLLGIFVEILAGILFILAGLLVCFFWWELIR